MNTRLQAAKEEAVKEYLQPNSSIIGVGVGTKDGKEECVRIYVIQRRDEKLVPGAQLVKKGKKFSDDVPVDVISFGSFGRHSHSALKDTGTDTQPGSPIGVKTDVGNINAGARGTLGAVVTDGKANYVLGCNHILAVNGRVPSNPNAATIVSAELVGKEVVVGSRDEYDDAYYAAFFKANRVVVERRLNESIAASAAMIAGAWEAAGKPPVPVGRPATPQRRRR